MPHILGPCLGATCCCPSTDWNLVVQSQRQESEREKEANIPWFMQITNKTLEQGLHCAQRHRVPSRGGLESRQESDLSGFPHSRELAGGRKGEREGETEREREKERHGDPSLWQSKGALIICLWVYIDCCTRNFFWQWYKSENQTYSNCYQGNKGLTMVIRSGDNPYLKKEDWD